MLDFVKQAFGAEEKFRMDTPDGKIGHAEVKIGDSIVMMGDAGEENPAMPAMIHLYVDDCDATYERALAAGGTSEREPDGPVLRRPLGGRSRLHRQPLVDRDARRGRARGGDGEAHRRGHGRAGRLSESEDVRFRKGAKLDPSQVEDYRGQGGGLGGLGGSAAARCSGAAVG